MDVAIKYFPTLHSASRAPPMLAPASVTGRRKPPDSRRSLDSVPRGREMARSPSREPPTDRENGGNAAAGVFRHRLGAATEAGSEAPRTGGRYARALPFPWRPPGAVLSWGRRRGAAGDPPAAQPRAA